MDLPNEIIKEIIDRIDSFNDKLALCFGNRRLFSFFNDLIKGDYDNENGKVTGFDTSKHNKIIKKTILSHRSNNEALLIPLPVSSNIISMIPEHIKSLVLNYGENEPITGLSGLIYLENLVLTGRGSIRLSELSGLISLKVLSLDVDVILDYELSNPSLKVINVRISEFFNDNPFHKLSLESLSISIIRNNVASCFKDSNYCTLITMTSLKSLCLKDSRLNETNLIQLTSMTNLKELEIHNDKLGSLDHTLIPCNLSCLNLIDEDPDKFHMKIKTIEDIVFYTGISRHEKWQRRFVTGSIIQSIRLVETLITDLTFTTPYNSITLICNDNMKKIRIEAKDVTIITSKPLDSMILLSVKAETLKVSIDHFCSIVVLNLNLNVITVNHIDDYPKLKVATFIARCRMPIETIQKISKITSLRELTLFSPVYCANDFECLSEITNLKLLRLGYDLHVWTFNKENHFDGY